MSIKNFWSELALDWKIFYIFGAFVTGVMVVGLKNYTYDLGYMFFAVNLYLLLMFYGGVLLLVRAARNFFVFLKNSIGWRHQLKRPCGCTPNPHCHWYPGRDAFGQPIAAKVHAGGDACLGDDGRMYSIWASGGGKLKLVE